MRIVGIVAFLAISAPAMAGPDYEIGYQRGSLGYEALMANDNSRALDQLVQDRSVKANDPAKLLNLGRAYARLGDKVKAEDAFTAALYCKDEMTLVLSDGKEINSRAAARMALRQLRSDKD
ncbi:MAG: tetratricopeptide repeat protein [Sphingorhabdus sp.]